MKGLCWSLLFVVLIGLTRSDFSPLNGKHLVIGAQSTIVHADVKRNSSGHILNISGVAVATIAVLSERYNFTYSNLQVNDSSLDKQANGLPGLGYYMTNGECDLVLGTIIMVPGRFASMDFAEGYTYTTVALVIPMPESRANAAAIVKPFQTSVWIVLFALILATGIALYFSIRPMPWQSFPFNWKKGTIQQRPVPLTANRIIFEVVRTLLSQEGKFSGIPRDAVYFVLGSWCLGAFVLVSAYNSVLVSYILGSSAQPLVDSVTDLAGKPDAHFVVNKGNEIDVVLSAARVGIYKTLGDKLRSDPKSRCAKRTDCVQIVKSEQYIYIQSMHIALAAIDEDFRTTNKCHLAIAKNLDPTPGCLAWALPKKSPYTRTFAKGFMELQQAGLVDFFYRKEQLKNKNANFCLNEADKRQRSKIFDNRTKITLKNFSGVFIVLISGCILSFLCFLGENLFSMLMALQNVKLDGIRKEIRV